MLSLAPCSWTKASMWHQFAKYMRSNWCPFKRHMVFQPQTTPYILMVSWTLC